MIRNSFIFLERVKRGLENSLWKQGIRDWDSFLNKEKIEGISRKRKLYYDRKIKEARKALYSHDSSYFIRTLPSSEYHLIYDFFKEDAVFLDIETSGLSPNYNDITLIGLYDGINTKMMIKGINLNHYHLKKELEKYKLIVTFNGSIFDIPFIEKLYPNTIPNIPNLDLRFTTAKLGMTGGLKSIEKQLGIERRKIIENFNGGDAVTLWRMYRATGDDYYLNLLIEYNEEDIINLKTLAEHCVGKIKSSYSTTNLQKSRV